MMIARVSADLYRYEIHALLKAFFPREEVKVRVDGEPTGGSRAQAEKEAALIPFLHVRYGDRDLEMTLRDSEGLCGRESGGDPAEEMFTASLRWPSEDFPGDWGLPEGTAANVRSYALKTLVKHMVYRLLAEATGRSLPWGELIGIRPTKIARDRLDEGATIPEAARYMEDSFYVSPEKAVLAAEIAQRERRILSGLSGEGGYSLYVGIPFCPTTCLYCSFPSNALHAWSSRVDAYLDALEAEAEAGAALMQGRAPDTIYIGGGTPTTLEPAQMERLIGILRRCYTMDRCLEFTVEAGRPDSITDEKLAVMKEGGVSRISINPQTMRDETLKIIGRRHTAAQTEEAFRAARDAGFDNINMDIILGLPGEDSGDVAYTTDCIRALAPDSLTVHTLAVKRGSRLQQWVTDRGYGLLMDTERSMETASRAAADMGMVPYYLYRQKNMTGNLENVGYATEGHFGIYNILIMEEVQSILALGAGSISKALFPGGRIERADNCKDVQTYLDTLPEMIARKSRLFGGA